MNEHWQKVLVWFIWIVVFLFTASAIILAFIESLRGH